MKYVKKILYLLPIISVMMLVFFVIWFIRLGRDDTCPFERFTLHDVVFEFSMDCSAEITWSIYCEVLKDGETIFSPTYIGRTGGGADFELVTGGQDGKMVAVIEKSTPNIVYAVYDLNNHQAGFFHLADVRDEDIQGLLQRFNTLKKGKPLIWPDEADNDMRSKRRLFE
ncbi:MAG: hypothetical protein GY801_41750 [bacterium]|nr:hypothetical protein [bacterium]